MRVPRSLGYDPRFGRRCLRSGVSRPCDQGIPVSSAPSLLPAALLVARKDLTIEFRTRSAFFSSLVFALVALCIFYFAWDPASVSAADLAPGVLWVIFTFSGLLGLQRSF